jgi:hypothetical protein
MNRIIGNEPLYIYTSPYLRTKQASVSVVSVDFINDESHASHRGGAV